MKRIKSILTVLMAAVFALSLVPVQAFGAAGDPVSGRIDAATPDTGSITVTNPKTDASDLATNSTYSVYKLLTLASFADTEGSTEADQHATDAYSYVISPTVPNPDYVDATTTPTTSQTIENPWYAFFNTSGNAGATYFDVDSANPVTIGGKTYHVVTPKNNDFKNPFSDAADATDPTQKDETDTTEWYSTNLVQKFAQDALAYATTYDIAPEATSSTIENDKVTFSDLELGYYLVSTTTGSLVALDTTNRDVDVYDKNTVPTVDKEVQEDRESSDDDPTYEGDKIHGYQKVNDANIGQEVSYRTVIRVEKGAQNYVLHDWMDEGLTYKPGSVKVWYVPKASEDTLDTSTEGWVELADRAVVTKGSGTGNTYVTTAHDNTNALVKGDFYTVNESPVDRHDFDVTFTQSFLTWLSDRIATANATESTTADDAMLVVEYKATVNENALIALPNKNETKLTYGPNDDHETATIRTDTYCWPVQVYKYTTDGSQSPGEKALAGATFQLWDSNNTTATGAKQFRFVEIAAGEVGYDAEAATAGITKQYKVYGGDVTTGSDASLDLTDDSTENATNHEVLDAITTDDTGKFVVCGLDEGDYYLHETVAPAGYNKLAWPVKVTVASDTIADSLAAGGTNVPYAVSYASAQSGGTYPGTLTNASSTDGLVKIVNQTGAELPSTGGVGTTIFYVAGTVLVVGAAVMLVAKRRMGAEA